MLNEASYIHLIGIKGQGMTALAELLCSEGKTVTGSDTNEKFSTDRVLQNLGIRVHGFRATNISTRVDLVVRSSAYDDTHMEVRAARGRGIPIMQYGEAIAELFNKKRGILITGTHGKTTTTAMIGCILEDAGFDPVVLVGATVHKWGRNARMGYGEWVVAEGDEYQNKFLLLKPELLVVTSVEYDHPDFFKTKREYEKAFRKLVASLPPQGLLIAEKGTRGIFTKIPCKVLWYHIPGTNEGRHWEANQKAACIVARHLGIPMKKSLQVLKGFMGTSRRTEFYTKHNAPVVLIDDYAHHPTEIRTTLADIRRRYPKRRIISVFQPHTFSRTQALMNEFSRAFTNADEVFLLPIFSSARERKIDFPKNLTELLLRRIRLKHRTVCTVSDIAAAVAVLKKRIRKEKNLVVITLGAGDGWKIIKTLASGKAK